MSFVILGYFIWFLTDEYVFNYSRMESTEQYAFVVTVNSISILMIITVFTVFRSAADTIRNCLFEDSKIYDEREIKMYEIQIDCD